MTQRDQQQPRDADPRAGAGQRPVPRASGFEPGDRVELRGNRMPATVVATPTKWEHLDPRLVAVLVDGESEPRALGRWSLRWEGVDDDRD